MMVAPGFMRLVARAVMRLPRSRIRRRLIGLYVGWGLRAFNRAAASGAREDFDAALAFLHPDIEWSDPVELPGGGIHRGRADLLAFWREFLTAWADMRVEADQVDDLDRDRALARVHWSAHGRQSGVPLDLRFFQLWEVREGLPARVRGYMDRDEALRAAR